VSLNASAWAWDQPVKPASAKLVLLCLADCHNAETGRCHPSHEHIARQTGLNEKTVPGALKALAELGLITIIARPGTSSTFTLNLPQNRATPVSGSPKSGVPQKRGTPKSAHPETGVPQNRGGTTPDIGVPPPPKPGDEPGKNQERTRKTTTALSLDCVPLDLIDVIEEFIQHRRNVKRPLTQNALERFLVQVQACSRELGIPERQVVTETIDAGWQSVKPDWLKRRLGVSDNPAPRGPGPGSTRQSTITDDLHDTSWAR